MVELIVFDLIVSNIRFLLVIQQVTLADALSNVEAVISLPLEPLDTPNIEAPNFSVYYKANTDTQFKDRGGFNNGLGKFAEEAAIQADLVRINLTCDILHDFQAKSPPYIKPYKFAFPTNTTELFTDIDVTPIRKFDVLPSKVKSMITGLF